MDQSGNQALCVLHVGRSLAGVYEGRWIRGGGRVTTRLTGTRLRVLASRIL
jgi:hypothetical protein